jgi:cytochrome c-type biogenesis protein CcmH
MLGFILLAAALAAAAAAAVAIPLVRRSPTALATAPWAALGAGALLLIGPAVLYVGWSNWRWPGAAAADSPQTMVAHLARRLEKEPRNLDGWLMLGRSYTVLEEYPLAVRAFQRADRLSDGKSAEALVGEAEALALTDESELDGRAGRLIERALALEPDSGKALFLGAAVAVRRGDLGLARARFAKLLAMNPPQAIRPILEQQLRLIDGKLASGGTGTPAPESPGRPAGSAAGASPGTSALGASGVPQAANAPLVRVDVTLAPTLAASGADAALYVFVRAPGEAGPPLAVKRLDSRFPQHVALSPADAMVPGRAFAAGQSVEVVARIARSGSPLGARGDPYGEVTYRVGHDGVVSLVIDRLTP